MKLLTLLIIMTMIPQDNSLIFDFKKQQSTAACNVVNDGVMGGLSKGKMSVNDAGNGVFEGSVTTENNGGFSSVRHSFYNKDVSNFTVVKLRIKGDGKPYQFRIKANEAQRYSYIQEFKTSGEWETIVIPFNSFYPSFRGNRLNRPNYDGTSMEEVTFLIGNKKKESFALEIDRIWME
jgi:NADH dehydrogenase [ubiquinone] 1 alpha subcomplex assembly factor 1